MRNNFKILHINIDKAVYLTALLTMIIMPVYHWYLPPLMILWVLLFMWKVFEGKDKFRNLDSNHKLLFFLFLIFFLWQLTGMSYSDNHKEGWRNIELRVSLLVFPLVMLFPGEMIRQNIKTLLKVFAVSTFTFLIICFIYAFYRSLSIQDGSLVFNPYLPEYSWLNYFYALDFAIYQHTSYLSVFTLLSVYISLDNFFNNILTKRIRFYWLFVALVLVISIYFLSSRAAILAAIITLPVYLFLKFKEIGKFRYFWITSIVMLGIFIPVVLTNPRVNNYFEWRAEHNISHVPVSGDREIIWKSVKTIIGKNLIFGVGTGDIQDELNSEYKNKGFYKLADVNTNAHNQYLEIFIENGLIGLIIFISMLALMFYGAIKNGNWIYLVFLLIVIISFMFETMLNRLSGVTFFSLFSFLLFINKKE